MPTSPTSNDGHAHVCLISDQPIPNLLPLLSEQPGQAIFLVSPQMAAQAERLKKVVQSHGIRVAMRKISAYYFDAVANTSDRNDLISEEITTRLTCKPGTHKRVL